MAETQIEWTESTWNPVAGCSIITPGCTYCYTSSRFSSSYTEPEQADKLRANPLLAPAAAEEIVRWVCSSKQKFRILTRDYGSGGKIIRKGDRAVLWLVSANRDKTVAENPKQLDLTRSLNSYVTFDAAEYRCLGRQLARLKMLLMLSPVVTYA